MSPIVLGEILRAFVNTLSADGKYTLQNCQNLQLTIQMQLFQKRKYFSQFFIAFLESKSNSKHYKKRMIVIANIFPKLGTVKILLSPLSKKRRFSTRFDSQHVKASQTVAKSP